MEKKLLSLLLFFCFTLIPSLQFAQENEAPKVEIIFPSENAKLESATIVPYSIIVSDKEDGKSEYDEINANEVVLTVTLHSDSSKIKNYVEEEVAPRAEMLSVIASSNCFTCHKAKDKLIGPSFEEIVNKYSTIQKSKSYLVQKISEGSKGIWGNEIMPAQPELEKEVIEQILDWIFKNAQDPNYAFYTGTEGAFKTKGRQKDNPDKTSYVLHALYTDHGTKSTFEKPEKGTHTIILNME